MFTNCDVLINSKEFLSIDKTYRPNSVKGFLPVSAIVYDSNFKSSYDFALSVYFIKTPGFIDIDNNYECFMLYFDKTMSVWLSMALEPLFDDIMSFYNSKLTSMSFNDRSKKLFDGVLLYLNKYAGLQKCIKFKGAIFQKNIEIF